MEQRCAIAHAHPGFARRLLTALACLVLASSAAAVTISVRGPAGEAVAGFRYTIEEDLTFDVVPDVTGLGGSGPTDRQTLSLEFHRSHMPVVKVGRVAGSSFEWTAPDSTKRYFVSVMPDNASFGDAIPSGYTMSGVPIRPGATQVVVPVNRLPFKTSQISVFVFEDMFPINNAPDAPGAQERGLCGFEVQLFEAGGTYGASGGRVSTDTFGNWLGTEYAFDASGNPQYNPDGSLAMARQGANQLFTDANGVIRVKNLSPAKYTIFVVPPPDMPSQVRCHLSDAQGQYPIWVRDASQLSNDAARRANQMVWRSPHELAVNAADGTQRKWFQTSTIEGTWGVDAWVKSGEPSFFKEFGPPGHHVFIGFTRRFKDSNSLNGNASVTGTVRNTHMSRPPGIRFHSGAPMTACWVGINAVTPGVGLGEGLYANACNADGTFDISGLRPGARYQLVVWDEPLDQVFASYEFAVPAAGGTVALGDVPVFNWFSNLQGKVFYDTDASGFPYDALSNAKPGIPGSVVNLRFRDGSIYQSTASDDFGNYEFAEVFPFFNWLVAETDFTRFKATGATIVADDGGGIVEPPTSTPELWPAGTMTPQPQPENGGAPYRIFAGSNDPASPSSANLLQNVQGFLGQTNVIHWGKREYNPADPNDHGGITGVVHYASTRAEFDPKFATPENNEPAVPNVEIRLYRLNQQNQVVVPGTNTTVTPSAANAGHAIQIVSTDSFDAARPAACPDPNPYKDRTGADFTTGPGQSKCYDGMRVWNQVRDGVFDGGFGFVDYCPAGVAAGGGCNPDAARANSTDPVPLPPGRYMVEGVAPYGYEHQKEEDKNVDFGDLLVPSTLANPAECIGARSEGITYDADGNPVPIAATVPAELELFGGVQIPEQYRGARPYCNKKLVILAPGMNPFADFHLFTKVPVAGHIVGMILDDLSNEFDPYAPTFGEKYAPPFMPVSIRDYAGNEINRVYSDRYGTYNALVPSTFAYNVPLPSGVAPNMVNVCLNSPTMKDSAGNTVLDPHYNPQYSQFCYTFQYLPGKTTYLDTPVLPLAAFAGPAQYALDCEQPEATPAIKMVSGATPVGGVEPGPWVPGAGSLLRIVSMGSTQVPNPEYDQTNLGTPGATVPPKTITRSFGFGATRGQVRIGGILVPNTNITSWTDAEILLSVPTAVANAFGGTVEVVHANGRRTPRGVTLHVGSTNMPNGHTTPRTVGHGAGYQFTSIQAAIDDPSTADGDLITVAPGLYEEAPIVWKRVRLQGYGAPATIVNAAMGADPTRQQAWRAKACDLVLNQGMAVALLPGQAVPANLDACLTGDTADNAPLLFAAEEASGFFVLQRPLAGNAASMANRPFIAASTNNNLRPVRALQIDGFTVTGADTGGAIVANGNAVQLQISNNRITGNQGLYNGGIRIGHAALDLAGVPVDANNLLVDIHHNEILKNGNTAGEVTGGGGAISVYTGARGYRVAQNYVCGNFSTGDGGGMAHFGASGGYAFTATLASQARLIDPDNRSVLLTAVNYASTVSNNEFRFNQSFSQAKSVQGGGLAIVGIIDPAAANGITLGTGDVTVINNTFQGNLAGAGDGGGIALVGVNGSADVNNGLRATWNRVDILNNLIVNNGAGVAGGGISLQDAANVNLVNNTVAMNDSYATAARAFQGLTNPTQANNCAQGLGDPACSVIAQSVTQDGAGIVAYGHSPGLLARLGGLGPLQQALAGNARWFSDANIVNSVVLGNRSYRWRIDYSISQSTCAYNTANGAPCFGLIGPESQARAGNDIAVLFAPAAAPQKFLQPSYSVFSALNAADGTSGSNNRLGDFTAPVIDFTSAYFNGANGSLAQLIVALEQSIPIGAPVLEVQEPTVATTAAAFDEGGNFIDVRFGPLTRGHLLGTGTWADFGTYNPTDVARAAAGDFGSGNAGVALLWPRLTQDRNGNNRSLLNWVRGALAQ